MQRLRDFGVCFWVVLLASGVSLAEAAQVTSIDFKGTDDPSQLLIRGDGPFTFEKQENSKDNQIILELKNATLSKGALAPMDTSSFGGNVSLISPYQVSGQDQLVRVVIQLKKPGSAEVAQEGNSLRVKIPNGDSVAAPSGDSTHLDEFTSNQKTQNFTGKPVTLQVKDADVGDVLRLVGEASGFNIVVGDDVKGKLTLALEDVPWDQALDVILHTLHLGAERSRNILRVVTLKNLTAEKQEEWNAQQAADASAPRVTRVFPISYANLTDLQGILTKFSFSMAGAAGGPGGGGMMVGGPGASPSSSVQVDSRTNSLIIQDIPERLEKMKKLIEILDTQTPQVMIEAKIVEASEGFSKSLGGSLGVGSNAGGTHFASFAGGNPVDSLVGAPGVFADGSKISSQSAPSSGSPLGVFGLSPNVSFIPGLSRLNAILSWGETENELKVVSAPKTVVLNKQKASIVQGTPVLVPGTTTVAGVGTVATTTVQQANLSLNVTPTVTNSSSVLMDLTVTKDVPTDLGGGLSGIGNRNMSTQVLVESGTTLVIGGIYTMSTNSSSSGFPFLRKIPILGVFFGNSSESTNRSELFIFITPRVLNVKEAGLSG